MLLIFAIGRNFAEEGAGLLTLGLVGGGHALALSVSSLLAGPLSDRVGRHRIILPGMCLFLFAAVVCAFASFGSWISLSMYWLSAFSLGMIHPATIAWVNTGKPSSKSGKSHGVSQSLVRFCISWNLGVFVAQVGGGELFLLSPTLPYFAAAVVMVANIFVAIRVSQTMSSKVLSAAADDDSSTSDVPIGEPDVPVDRPDVTGGMVEAGLATSTVFIRLAWMANLGGAVAVSMLLHLLPRLAVGLDIPADQHGVILASMRVTAIGVYILLHKTSFWHFRFSVNLIVQLVCAVGLFAIYFAQGSLLLIVGVSFVAILVGFNYFSGIYYGSAGHEESKRGFASGMHEATLGIGVAIGSAGGGILGSIAGERFPYFLASVVVIGLVVLQIFYYVKQKNTRHVGHVPGVV